MNKKLKKAILIIAVVIIMFYLVSVISGISSYIVYNIEKSYISVKTSIKEKLSDFHIIKNSSEAGG